MPYLPLMASSAGTISKDSYLLVEVTGITANDGYTNASIKYSLYAKSTKARSVTASINTTSSSVSKTVKVPTSMTCILTATETVSSSDMIDVYTGAIISYEVAGSYMPTTYGVSSMLTILSSLAESESVSISENEKWSIQRRFKNGSFVIGYPPFGYKNEDGKMVIVPEEAEVVKQIYAASLAGIGTYKIAKDLNARGIKTKKNGAWTDSTVKGILTNEKYTGDVIFQKTYTDSCFNRHVNYGECDQYLVKDHHEAIISHEDFDRTAQVLAQRGKEKSNTGETGRYQKRYAFSGKIKCGSCGATFKRRFHYKPSGAYIAWTCSKHLEDKNACGMMYLRQIEIEAAFVTMMNKLIFSEKRILKPFVDALRGTNDKDRLRRVQALEEQIDKVNEQRQVVAGLMTSGYLEPAVYAQESGELQTELERLQTEKTMLSQSINGSLTHAEEAQKILRFTSRTDILTAFDEEVFTDFVDEILVLSREQIEFRLKCGLNLKERLVRE